MNLDRRRFAQSLTGIVGALVAGSKAATSSAAKVPASLARAQARLSPAVVTRIRVFYPPNYNPNGPQAFPQSNMVVLVDTDAGITGIGQGGSPDTVRNVARSVIGKNAFDSEMIWQAAFMDGWHHRDAQDHGGVRYTQGGHRPALHRANRDGRPHAHHDGVSRASVDGVQPGRAPGAVPARVSRVPERQGVAKRPAGPRRQRRREAADVYRGRDRGAPGITHRRPDGSLTHW